MVKINMLKQSYLGNSDVAVHPLPLSVNAPLVKSLCFELFLLLLTLAIILIKIAMS